MNSRLVKIAVIPGLTALAAIALSLVIPFPADVTLGVVAVLAIFGLAAQDYGHTDRGISGN
ncbi:MAG TPA: hypothetical protein VGL42_17580 [Opitutaceae bacterium]|jgi:hypothetical protein